jgi:asparagine synthase (glutamine-hydrolysing)
MCGIAGALSRSPVAEKTITAMRDTLAHRGPDAAAVWRSRDERVALGHRRLAIIDLDARSNQPMVSHDGRLVITFNGEIYNYKALRRELELEGVAFRTQSDTEVLLEAFRRWGQAMPERLSGQFAFAIWDADTRRLFCARDRAGEKPFHYALVDGAFLFASEIKALLEWPGFPRRIDHQALIDFLAMGFIADPKTVWRDIRKLPPAHWISVELSEAGAAVVEGPTRYWSLRFAPRDRDVSADELRAALVHAADETAVADVPLGTFLSGGVDSSAVTAALSLSGHDVRSFTIGFDEAGYDERPWARQVAERYHTRHTERTVDASDVVPVMDRLNWHYDEPFGDYSSIPTYYLCREARQSITVALSGDGADELFAGYRKYQRLARRAELSGVLPRGVAAFISKALPDGKHWHRTLRQYGLAAPQMLTDMLCIGFPLPLLRQVARGPLAEALRDYDPSLLVEELLTNAPPEEVGLINAMRHLDFALTLPGDMLVKVDRASMASSLEVRALFLQRDVMELAAAIPPRQLANRDAAKLLLKDAARPWLPHALLDRRKQGFAMPLPQWLREESALGGRLQSPVGQAPVDELLDATKLVSLRTAHANGVRDATGMLHGVFVLGQWFERWSGDAVRDPSAASPYCPRHVSRASG